VPAAAPLSCQDCPNFLTTTQASNHFNKSIGAPVCALHGHVFGKMQSGDRVTKKLAQHYAQFCNDYGMPRATRGPISLFNIAIGEQTQAPVGAVPPITLKPEACSTCKFFVSEEVVAEELSWTTPLCRKRGHLMLGSELRKVASACDEGEVGPQTRSTHGVTLFPELLDNFGVLDATSVGGFLTQDPKDVTSDKEVTDDEKAQGIIAWREITSPDPDFEPYPGDEVYLPIFSDSIFTELDQSIIPKTNDKEHPEEYVDHFGGVYSVAVHLTKLNMAPAVWGEPGTGKTELFRHLAWMTGMPFRRFTITASSELDDLAGKPHYSPELGTYFAYGRFVQAYQTMCWLCVDEWNLGPKDVQQFFRPLIDNSKQLAMDVNIGELLYPTPFTYMGFAMNPPWDLRNVGAEMLADADTNRLMHIEVPMPDEPVELAIIQKHLAHDGWQLDDNQAKLIMKAAEEIRGLINEGPLAQISWGLRPQIKVARALRYFSPVAAYRQAVANTLDPTTREILLMAVKGNAS
jgi:MoxR-like ATPase